jgi:hypothetical protein
MQIRHKQFLVHHTAGMRNALPPGHHGDRAPLAHRALLGGGIDDDAPVPGSLTSR